VLNIQKDRLAKAKKLLQLEHLNAFFSFFEVIVTMASNSIQRILVSFMVF
jgi:hypothetical protein